MKEFCAQFDGNSFIDNVCGVPTGADVCDRGQGLQGDSARRYGLASFGEVFFRSDAQVNFEFKLNCGRVHFGREMVYVDLIVVKHTFEIYRGTIFSFFFRTRARCFTAAPFFLMQRMFGVVMRFH